MRRLFALLLAALLIFSLAACSFPENIPEYDDRFASDDDLHLIVDDGPSEDTEEPSADGDIAGPEEGESDIHPEDEEPAGTETEQPPIAENGVYTSKEDVALYIHTYGHLPGNFITKKEAEALGWPGGSLEPYAPGMCIGGSYFGNYEGLLPEKEGRRYTECDIDTLGASSRGAKRIVFSNDGLIYYTEDHYESFELLYGEENL